MMAGDVFFAWNVIRVNNAVFVEEEELQYSYFEVVKHIVHIRP